MKVLLIADPHFGLTLTGTNLIPKELKDEKFIISLENKFQFFIEDINNPYTLLLLKSFEWLEQFVIQVDKIILLGDIFDCSKNKKISMIDLYLALKCLENIYELNNNQKLILIAGNHDLIKEKKSYYSLLNIFKNIADIFYEPSYIKFENEIFGLIPYANYDRNTLLNLLKDFEKKSSNYKNKYIFSHIDINDFYKQFGKETDFINAADFKENIVFNGHYHTYSLYNNKRFINIGSLVSTSFNQLKTLNNGVVILDTEKNSWKLIRNPYTILFLKIKESKIPILKDLLNKKIGFIPFLALEIYIEDEKYLNILKELPVVTYKKTYEIENQEDYKFLDKLDINIDNNQINFEKLLKIFLEENYPDKNYEEFKKISKQIFAKEFDLFRNSNDT